jgi:hypothetical protein
MSPTLSKSEEKLLALFVPPTARRKTFSELLGAWEHIIENIEDGYRLGLDDYTNDLTVRGILERGAQGVDARLRTKVETLMAPLDARFEDATFVSKKPPFPGALARNPSAWWYTRLPNKLIGELKEDAHRWGLVA